ncbi:MAG TPA: DUF502 domain-containing protein [Gammaproteobacteria bacterium]|nr:DUF502 domain-containing protein [Gammaproteobacteria bacterium]
MWAFIRKALIGGLLVWLPIIATLWIIEFIVGLMDRTLAFLPEQYQIPGLGLVIAVCILLATGILVGNFVGRKFIAAWEYLLDRIPLVRSIYSAIKQVLQTVLVPSGQSFRQVMLVRFPHQDSWTVAFLVGPALKEVNELLNQDLITVYVPTTPNPTSGYIMLLKKEDTRELNMSVEEALKYVISLGVVQPKKIGAH